MCPSIGESHEMNQTNNKILLAAVQGKNLKYES